MTAPVSVVLTVLNEATAIGGLLDDLLAQDAPADEILVVDGGSTDGTQSAVSRREGVRLICQPGANISQGRNRGISQARSELVAVTDAGVRLGPDWLRKITAPLQEGEADVAAGFFEPDPHGAFERAMGATVLPALEDVEPSTFLPSSRSLAFRKDVWRRAGGYPEWLDYCEDLIFDMNIRRKAGVRVAFVPEAVARFRPRSSLGAFFRQYYRYARGDGKADLWRKRHAFRYLTYAHLAATIVCLFAPNARRRPKAVAYFGLSTLAGSAVYLRKPVRRLAATAKGASMADWLYMLALIPVIRLVGDVAKMAGYPAGWWWRLQNHPPDWRDAVTPPTQNSELETRNSKLETRNSLDLTVIVVNYNVRELLRDCLRSLQASRSRWSFEIIVVDNCSADGSAEMVAAGFPDVRLIVSPSNDGFAAANNRGIRAAKPSRYVMLLNPDTLVPPDALEGLVDFMEAHPGAGVVGPKLVKGDGALDLACRRSFPTPRIAFYHAFGLDKLFPTSPEFAQYNLTYLDEDELNEVDCVVGAAMLVRCQALEQAGLLDESFFMYGEDLDWAFRIRQQGWKVFYNPAVVIVHYKGQSSRQRSVRSILAFYDAMVTFHRKHYASGTVFAVNWAILLGIGLRCLMALLANLFRPQAMRAAR